MKYILALDQGTTSSRAIVFDKHNNIICVAQREYEQIYPQAGWVEHNPMEIWASQLGVVTTCLASSNIQLNEIAAVGITNQRETTILWDKTTGQPVYNAIVWQDRRTTNLCNELKAAGKESLVTQKTGLVLDPYFSGTKIKWILDNVPRAKILLEQGNLLFGTVDTWLVWKLTDGKLHITDYTNASRTLLFDIHTKKWDKELLELFGIPESILPEVRQSSELYGYVDESILGYRVPIASIAGDQHAATFGQACLKAGMAKNTYGTGSFTLLNTGSEVITNKNKIISTIAWGESNEVTYALEGSVFISGAVVQWLRDGLNFFHQSSEIEEAATKVNDNGGVYFVPAFAGLGAPYWDPQARGMIIGLTRGVNKYHIARAALEGIAFQCLDIFEAMQTNEGQSTITLQELRVDGGASRNNFLMQLQADILNTPVVRPKVTETTALGAAYLAGLAIGFWESKEEIYELWQVDRVYEPRMNGDERENLIHNWRKAIERVKKWENI